MVKNMKKEKSCGCVIIDEDKVLLIRDTNQNWGFPKGHMEENETEVETAKRETKEEVNIDVEIDENKRYETVYVTKDDVEKTVVYFVAKPINKDLIPQNGEIEDIEWVSFEKAMEQITYDDTRDILRKIIANT